MANVTASTKRRPAISGGKIGTPATTNITSMACTPLDPVDPELRRRLGLDTPHELLQTLVDSTLDIREGDILVVSSNEYPIRAVSDWAAGATAPAFKHLIVEDLKR